MTWGLMVRSETDRGLGVLTHGMYDHLNPDRTLVVRINAADHTYKQYTEHFNGQVISWPDAQGKPLFNEAEFRSWVKGLDVLVGVETWYDKRVPQWCREAGVKTILYVMPEMLSPDTEADVFWYPTTWRTTEDDIVLPVPVTPQAFVEPPADDQPVVFIHVAGKKALGDRNGTELIAQAIRRTRGNGGLLIYSQTDATRLPGGFPAVAMKGPADKHEMYRNAHVHVMPRRYGGLCLPVLESLSHGLALTMTDVSPNNDWPNFRIECEPAAVHDMPCGSVQTHACTLQGIANNMIRLMSDRDLLRSLMAASREWVQTNTWDVLAPKFHEALNAS